MRARAPRGGGSRVFLAVGCAVHAPGTACSWVLGAARLLGAGGGQDGRLLHLLLLHCMLHCCIAGLGLWLFGLLLLLLLLG